MFPHHTLSEKEIAMQAVLDFINKHHYDIFIPLTALAVLRIIVCRAQLKKIASLREKKGAYHAVGGNYTEIGVWLGTLPGLVLALAAPKLWYAGLVLAVIGGILLGKAGKKKGAELDDIYREVALELKREAEAEAARQEASRALEGGAEEIPEATEITENKGETNNG